MRRKEGVGNEAGQVDDVSSADGNIQQEKNDEGKVMGPGASCDFPVWKRSSREIGKSTSGACSQMPSRHVETGEQCQDRRPGTSEGLSPGRVLGTRQQH